MSENELDQYFEDYVVAREKMAAMISVSGFKKYLMINKKIKRVSSILSQLPNWIGVRGELEILEEEWLIANASKGERHSANYVQMLNKLYEKQARRGGDQDKHISITLDFKNEGVNKI